VLDFTVTLDGDDIFGVEENGVGFNRRGREAGRQLARASRQGRRRRERRERGNAARQRKRAASGDTWKHVRSMGKLSAGLDNDLLFIAAFHPLIEIAQCAVILNVEMEDIQFEDAGNMFGAFLIFHLHRV